MLFGMLELLYPENEGNTILLNFEKYSHNDTALHPRRLQSYSNLLWECHITQINACLAVLGREIYSQFKQVNS